MILPRQDVWPVNPLCGPDQPHTRAPCTAAGKPVEAAIKAEPGLPAQAAADEAGWSDHRFTPAAKRITSADALQRFLASQTAHDFVAFILALNEAVKGHRLSDACHVSSSGF